MVKRLAPEVRIDGCSLHLDTPEDVFRFNSRGVQSGMDVVCCSETFEENDRTPEIEKSLTIYLWWKLFQKDFVNRQTRWKWESTQLLAKEKRIRRIGRYLLAFIHAGMVVVCGLLARMAWHDRSWAFFVVSVSGVLLNAIWFFINCCL
jgi:hypothetical protein